MRLIPRARPRNAAALVGLLAFCGFAGADDRAAAAAVAVVRSPAVAAMDAGPVWVSLASWDAAEERIVIADPGSGRIYVYDAAGKIHRRIANPGRGSLEFTKPNYAVRVGDRYAIATSPRRWLWFDQTLEPRSLWELDWEKGAGPHSQLVTSDFAFSDTHLYAIGTVLSFAGTWSEKAIFSVSLADRSVKQVARLGNDIEETSYYNAPPFNLSVCGGRAWLLQMSSTVSIVEALDGGKRLRSFPAEFQRRPSIPPIVDAGSVRGRTAALRAAPVAEGLFCSGDRLLLLAHRPGKEGGLQWLVYPIDPSRDTIATPVELPTTSGEIVFVPGRTRWAVLEKGPMKYVGVQPLTRVISFPSPLQATAKVRSAP